jgi:hypothetical protein
MRARKQWGDEYWSTSEVAFWTNLKKGEVIQFGFNSSAPVVMELGYGMVQTSILWKTGSSLQGFYRPVQDGVYYFYFFINDSVHKSEDITVSFKCYEAANRAAVNIPWFGDNKNK